MLLLPVVMVVAVAMAMAMVAVSAKKEALALTRSVCHHSIATEAHGTCSHLYLTIRTFSGRLTSYSDGASATASLRELQYIPSSPLQFVTILQKFTFVPFLCSRYFNGNSPHERSS